MCTNVRSWGYKNNFFQQPSRIPRPWLSYDHSRFLRASRRLRVRNPRTTQPTQFNGHNVSTTSKSERIGELKETLHAATQQLVCAMAGFVHKNTWVPVNEDNLVGSCNNML